MRNLWTELGGNSTSHFFIDGEIWKIRQKYSHFTFHEMPFRRDIPSSESLERRARNESEQSTLPEREP